MKKTKKNSNHNGSKYDRSLVPHFRLHLDPEIKRGIAVVVFLILTGIVLLSIFRIAGDFGQWLFNFLLLSFGMVAYLVPILFLCIAFILLRHDLPDKPTQTLYARTYIGAFILFAGIAGLIHLFFISVAGDAFTVAGSGRGAGYFGALVAAPIFSLLGFWAGALLLIGLVLIGILLVSNIPLHTFIFRQKTEDTVPKLSVPTVNAGDVKINTMAESEFTSEKVKPKQLQKEKEPAVNLSNSTPITTSTVTPKVVTDSNPLKLESITLEDRRDWKLPPFNLLDESSSEVDSGNIEANVAIIQKTLHDFSINVEMGEVNVGPTVTQYTLRPTTGVKLSQIAGLRNDLALALAAHSIRMELPIPGKPLVGIEVPNKATAIVRLREVMQTSDFINHPSKLAVALGRDVAGKPQIADLAKMPHLLIAGATGTGKSVAINSLLISLLYRNTPQDVKFILVDPKRVEMTLYNGVPHLLTAPVTDPEKAVNAMKWAVSEMDRRYKLFAEAKKRNIVEYNSVSPLALPYICIIVDELADLMAVAQADIEAAIVRLAQMARAVGIHLVLATQRPSVDIITGLIKANITSRVAFAVASGVDSRTILDSSGAEQLLGNGDMLFVSAEFNKPRRVQGAYIGEKEVAKVVDFFKVQTGAVIYNEEILERPKRGLGLSGSDEGSDDDDTLLDEAKQEVMRAGKASASFLQRRLKVGYARAARLLDLLEERGIIGPGDGAKPREVYGVIPPEEKAEYGVEEEDSFQ